MLLGGYSSCQGCGCVPCKECTRTCTEPHTGDAFEVVYTKYTLGVQAGNLTDGYLTAEGDNDTSDPVDGMDGSGPWYQRVSGGFTLGGPTPGTRFPCSVRVSFWRTSGAIGANNPNNPPSTALTENTIEVIVSSGALVAPDGRVITPADGAVAVSSVPLVSGSTDPRTGDGTVSFQPDCWSVETIVTVRATIRWATQKRQHTLYGIVRECYEETPPTNCCPAGLTLPNELYVTISNYTGPVGQDFDGASMVYNGTYVLSRVAGFCSYFLGEWDNGCSPAGGQNPLGASLGIFARLNTTASIVTGNAGYIAFLDRLGSFSGVCRSQGLHILSPTTTTFCGTGVIASGTDGENYMDFTQFPFSATRVGGSFDWEIST